jgi:hypothetical protein
MNVIENLDHRCLHRRWSAGRGENQTGARKRANEQSHGHSSAYVTKKPVAGDWWLVAGNKILVLTLITACLWAGCARGRPPASVSAPAASAQTPAYTGLGGGHLLRTVSDDGRYVTLEDASVWEIEPGVRFQTMDWQPQAPITVRTTRGMDGYNYEIVNTQDDEGAMARFIPRR